MIARLARKSFRLFLRVLMLCQIISLINDSEANCLAFAENYEKAENWVTTAIDQSWMHGKSIASLIRQNAHRYFVRLCFSLMLLVVASFYFRFFLVFVGVNYLALRLILGDYLSVFMNDDIRLLGLLKIVILGVCCVSIGLSFNKRT